MKCILHSGTCYYTFVLDSVTPVFDIFKYEIVYEIVYIMYDFNENQILLFKIILRKRGFIIYLNS